MRCASVAGSRGQVHRRHRLLSSRRQVALEANTAIRRDRFLLPSRSNAGRWPRSFPSRAKRLWSTVGDDFNWGWTQVQLKRTLDALETALYHTLGNCLKPKSTHEFF